MENTGMPNSIKSFIKVHKDGNCALAVFQGMQPSFKNIHQLHCRASIWQEPELMRADMSLLVTRWLEELRFVVGP